VVRHVLVQRIIEAYEKYEKRPAPAVRKTYTRKKT
jgi:phosphate starvation-inducible protein PhoH